MKKEEEAEETSEKREEIDFPLSPSKTAYANDTIKIVHYKLNDRKKEESGEHK